MEHGPIQKQGWVSIHRLRYEHRDTIINAVNHTMPPSFERARTLDSFPFLLLYLDYHYETF